MEIKDLLTDDQLNDIYIHRQKQPDSETILPPDEVKKYQIVAEKLIKQHGKGFIIIKRAKNRSICGLVFMKKSYKFRIRYPGVMEVFNNQGRCTLEEFLANRKDLFNKLQKRKSHEQKTNSTRK